MKFILTIHMIQLRCISENHSCSQDLESSENEYLNDFLEWTKYLNDFLEWTIFENSVIK